MSAQTKLKNSSTSEKVASRSKQSGRSMIEMLGVLAIIGVLTVGSITGYSHAMRRHLLNKQRQQISYILSAVDTHREMVDTSLSSKQSYNLKPIFETFGWIPEEMIRENDNVYIYDVFGNQVYLYAGTITFALAIYLANDNPHEQCVNLYQMIQQYHQFIKMGFVEVNAAGNYSYTNRYYGDIGPDNQGCNANHNCIKDLTPTKISELCRVCDNKTRCRFFIYH